MADVTINLMSQPTMPTGTTLTRGDFAFSSKGLQSNASISHSGVNSGYIKFDACVGTVKATIGVSSESNCDFMMLHVSTTTSPPSRNGGNMANISGEVSSRECSYNITTAGTYYLHFTYAKDGSVHSGSDIGWITQATLPLQGGVYTNVSGVWKNAMQHVNVNGVWKSGATYSNVNGVWKIGQ